MRDYRVEDVGGMKVLLGANWPRQNWRRSVGSLAAAYEMSGWAFRCVRVKARALSGLPWGIYRGLDMIEDSLPEAVLRQFDGERSFKSALRYLEGDMNVYGFAVWAIVGESRLGTPLRLQRMNPGGLTMEEDNSGKVKGWKIDGGSAYLAREDAVYFYDYSPKGDFEGLAPMQVALNKISSEYNVDLTVEEFYENGARPDFLMVSEREVKKSYLEAMVAWWQSKYGGRGRQWQPGFVGGGFKPEKLHFSPQSLAQKDLKEGLRLDICAIFDVPPGVAGIIGNVNRSDRLEQRKELIEETTVPQADYYAEVITNEFVARFEPGLEMRFRPEELAILQADQEGEARRVFDMLDRELLTDLAAAARLGIEPDEMPVGIRSKHARSNGRDKEEKAERHELGLWRKKAMRRMKEKGNAAVDFDSEIIPISEKMRIAEGLRNAKSLAEVLNVFKSAEV